MRRQGTVTRVGDGVWVIDGAPNASCVLVSLTGADIELRVSTAVEWLNALDEPADLVSAAPPYALGQGEGKRRDVTARTSEATDREGHVVPGYVDDAGCACQRQGHHLLH
jgi:hypothetical protein